MVQSESLVNLHQDFVVTQEPSPGTLINSNKKNVKLFQPLKIKEVELNNRFVVSPMCTYSCEDGFMTDFHLVHLGQFALHGVGLTIVEVSAVAPEGRISPNCVGIWTDEHLIQIKKIVDFFHSQGNKIGIQIGHAGRKASTYPPFHPRSRESVSESEGGWDNIKAPSELTWGAPLRVPEELSIEEIKKLVSQFKDAAERVHKAGFDVIEIHGAHGYLIHQFLSPISNKRTDIYGGSFENRTRFLIEIVEAINQVWPKTKPVFVRLSCTDWISDQPSWDIEQTVALSKILYGLGVDLIDCSSSGSSPLQKIPASPGFQVPFATQIRKEVPGLLTGAVGLLTKSEQLENILQNEEADLVLMARQFLKNPNFVKDAALELGVDIKWANQYERGKPRPKHEAF